MAKTVPKIEIEKIRFLAASDKRKAEISNFVEEWNNSSVFFSVQTSGSTGKPKSLQLSKEYAVASALTTGSFFNYEARDVLVLCLSLSGIGAKMQLIRAACFDMEVLVCDAGRNPLEVLDTAVKQISVVPLQLQEMMQHSKEKMHLLESILLGGAALDTPLRKQVLDFNLPVFESYGMSETYSHVALRKVAADNTLFEALPGIGFSCVDEKLCIHAPHLGIDKLQTNDIVSLHGNTTFEWLGRADFAINSGAYKFIPEVLEQKLKVYISENFFIIGEKDKTFGEIVTLVAEAHYSLDLHLKIESCCKKYLNRYEVPKKIYFVPEFIRTETGKINRLETQKKAFES